MSVLLAAPAIVIFIWLYWWLETWAEGDPYKTWDRKPKRKKS